MVTLEDIEASSSSSEDEDVSIDQSVGGSVKKYLPKPLLGRKSVFISGNLKRGGTKPSPKKKLGKSRKNLNPMMDRISREGMKKEEEMGKVEKEKVEPRRSSGRAATKAAGQSLSPAVLQVVQALFNLPCAIMIWGLFVSHQNMKVALATSADQAFIGSTASSTPADSGETEGQRSCSWALLYSWEDQVLVDKCLKNEIPGASAGNTPSYQNFSTESAKEIIAKLQVDY